MKQRLAQAKRQQIMILTFLVSLDLVGLSIWCFIIFGILYCVYFFVMGLLQSESELVLTLCEFTVVSHALVTGGTVYGGIWCIAIMAMHAYTFSLYIPVMVEQMTKKSQN